MRRVRPDVSHRIRRQPSIFSVLWFRIALGVGVISSSRSSWDPGWRAGSAAICRGASSSSCPEAGPEKTAQARPPESPARGRARRCRGRAVSSPGPWRPMWPRVPGPRRPTWPRRPRSGQSEAAEHVGGRLPIGSAAPPSTASPPTAPAARGAGRPQATRRRRAAGRCQPRCILRHARGAAHRLLGAGGRLPRPQQCRPSRGAAARATGSPRRRRPSSRAAFSTGCSSRAPRAAA